MRRRFVSVFCFQVVLVVAGCGPKAGKERPECFDGEGIRYTMDCDSMEWVNDGQNVKGSGGLHVGDWVGIKGKAETENVAIREIGEELQSYAVKWNRLCQDYNSCAVSKESYIEESKKLRSVLDEHGFQKYHQAILAAQTPEEKRRLIADAYETIVPSERRRDLYLEFSVLGGNSPETLSPLRAGASLHTNDNMAFLVKPSSRAYIYLIQQTGSGEMNVIFPDDRIAIKNPVAAGQSMRIPDNGTFRVNDKDIGTEKVFIVASLNPISNATQAAEALGKADGSSSSPSEVKEISNKEGQAKSSNSGCNTRALELDGSSGGCARTRGIVLDSPPTDKPSESAGTAPSMRVKTEAADTTIVQVFQFEHLE